MSHENRRGRHAGVPPAAGLAHRRPVRLCGRAALLAKVFAEFSLSDGWLTMTGAAMMLATIAAYVMAIVRTYATK